MNYIQVNNLCYIFIIWLSIANCQPACPLGSILEDGECVKCPAGTFYRETNGTVICQPCPAGHYNPIRGIQGLDLCRPCPSGTFNPNLGSTSINDCKSCPPDTNSQEGSPRCISCPPNSFISNCRPLGLSTFPSEFRGLCFPCSSSASDITCGDPVDAEPQCEKCFPDFLRFSGPNALECKICPDGQMRDGVKSRCLPRLFPCPAGSTDYLEGCRKCERFSFNDGTFQGCRTCPAGTQGNQETGSSSCVDCPSGTFKTDPTAEKCEPCDDGENSFVTGARYCFKDNVKVCAPGFFRSKGGACIKCSVFEKYDTKNQICVPCPDNSLSMGGLSTTCVPCPAGMRTNERYNRCICEPGFGFVRGSNGSRCEKCPPGSTNLRGTDYCSACRRGTFAPEAGMTSCLGCPIGTSQPKQGESRCVGRGCENGLIPRRFVGCVEPETNCPPGHRRGPSTSGSVLCEPLSNDVCPEGTALMYGSGPIMECLECPKDNRYVPERNTCERCGRNEVNPPGVRQECTRCENGTRAYDGECLCAFGRQWRGGRCVQCPEGTVGLDRIDGCRECPAGTFADKFQIAFCNDCPAGSFTDLPGQTACKQCPEGMTNFGLGETGCIPIPKS